MITVVTLYIVATSCMIGSQVALTLHRIWMLKGDGCSYYTGALKSHKSVEGALVPPVYDIEDMINVGSRRKFCPYFTLRNLLYASQIVFCPYNYLIDPTIRESVSILPLYIFCMNSILQIFGFNILIKTNKKNINNF